MALCPVHHVEFKLIPAGVSKTTGKPYNAFYACPERGCKEKPGQTAPQASAPAYVPNTASGEMVEQLKRIATALEKIADADLKNIPFGSP